jgi:endonuclease YncB( thermonuclease family)
LFRCDDIAEAARVCLGRPIIMEATDKIIRRLIEHSTVAAVRVRTGSGELRVEARFVKEGLSEGTRGVWVRLAGGDSGLIDRLIEGSTPILIGADDGPRRVTFVSSFAARRRSLLGGEQVLVAWPGEVKSEERRRAGRERIPPDTDIAAWLVEAGPAAATTGGFLAVQVWDVSTEGACLVCPAGAVAALKAGAVVQLRLRLAGGDYRVGARVCRCQTVEGGRVRVGVQFVGDGVAEVTRAMESLVENLRAQRVRRGLNRALVKGG